MINPEFLNTYLLSIVIFSLLLNTALALYGIFYKPHYIKKVICLTILSDTANTFAIYIGYRRWLNDRTINPRPPVLPTTEVSPGVLSQFLARAVDPLPQALVLTAVVIGLAVTVFLIFLGHQLYLHYGTLDMRRIRKLKG
ncbi:MAG: sodium:proton antiporter [Thermosphaera sp.]